MKKNGSNLTRGTLRNVHNNTQGKERMVYILVRVVVSWDISKSMRNIQAFVVNIPIPRQHLPP